MVFKTRQTSQSDSLGWGLRVWTAGVGLLLVVPTLVVIPMSFSDSDTFAFPPEHWSTRWYQAFFSSAQWRASLINSIEVGLLTALIATALGVASAIGLHRSRFRVTGGLRSVMMAPMIVPGIVVAIGIYSVFLRWHLNGTLLGFVLAHTVLAVPFVVTSVTASLANFDATVEIASASLGANWWTTFRRVTLPLLLPGVATGFVFAFVTSLDEVVVSLFLQTPSMTTLPVQMYQSITLEIDPTIGAAASLIVVVTTAVLALALLLRRPTVSERS